MPDFNSQRMRFQPRRSIFTWIAAVWVVSLLIGLTTTGAVIYVVYHFLHKLW